MRSAEWWKARASTGWMSGIFRNFNLVHGITFTLRGEGFNVLNHVNWGSVGTSATSSTFGRVTSTRDPRILQVAGKINF